ncbi:MAG: T9SS type A sorting domain-containing protein [Cyclonatronaceae bacterium]
MGDPDNGGTLIEGEDGNTIVYAPPIPARHSSIVQMPWTLPGGIGTRPYIYGVIDPEKTVPEIHEHNNKGWNRLGGPESVGVEDGLLADLPVVYSLHQNYPNPFNPGTAIEFSMPEPGTVTLTVYNILGQRVATLASGRLDAGTHSRYWDATGLASGVYLYRLSAGGYSLTNKMMLMK